MAALGLGVLDEVLDDCASAGLQYLDGACLDVVEQSQGEVCDSIDCLEAQYGVGLSATAAGSTKYPAAVDRAQRNACWTPATRTRRRARTDQLCALAQWATGDDYAPTLNQPAQECASDGVKGR